MIEPVSNEKALIVGIGECLCALPLTNVIETMRPLPIEPIADAPSFVRGVAIIRGVPTPVVDAGAILGVCSRTAPERFVTVRTGDKQVALSVDRVLGIREFTEPRTAPTMPPLLQYANNDIVETIGTLDERFLMVLRGAWALPEEIWGAAAVHETS